MARCNSDLEFNINKTFIYWIFLYVITSFLFQFCSILCLGVKRFWVKVTQSWEVGGITLPCLREYVKKSVLILIYLRYYWTSVPLDYESKKNRDCTRASEHAHFYYLSGRLLVPMIMVAVACERTLVSGLSFSQWLNRL